MSEDGGSDLDIFDQLAKGSSPKVSSAKQTLLGMQAPPNLPPVPGNGPSTGRSAPPPPPPFRASRPPPPPPFAGAPAPGPAPVEEISVVEEIPEELDMDDETRVEPPESSSTNAGPPPPPLPAPTTSGPPPPPPFPTAPSAAAIPPLPFASAQSAADEDEWGDDEDEKTTIFEGPTAAMGAVMFTQSRPPPTRPPTSRPAPPPAPAPPMPPFAPSRPPIAPMANAAPPPPMSRPPAALPIPPAPPRMPSPMVPMMHPMSTPMPPPPTSSGKSTMLALVGFLVVLGGVLAYFLMPGTGTMVVTVAGPGNQPLDAVEVFIDDKKVCSGSPCQAKELAEGTHMVRATAAGYRPTAQTAVKVSRGQEAVHNISLVKAPVTGITVTSPGKGLRLSVDGKEIGPLPQEVKDLTAGTHTVTVSGGKRFETYESTVNLADGQMLAVGPLKLKVLKGLATIKAGKNADGARVIITSGKDRRTLPSLPKTLEIDPSKPHEIIASKDGYETFRHQLEFDDGVAEQVVEIELEEGSSGESAASSSRSSYSSSRSSRGSSASSAPAPKPAAGGMATLNINSIPRSNVILDGRPLGATPKLGVSVTPGRHTVVFIMDGQRKTSTVVAMAGGSRTVAVRF